MISAGEPTGEGPEPIRPDEKFMREVVRRGGGSVKTCFQCGACSVTCQLSYAREGAAFPRRQILWTQWGLKDRVLRDPAIWQCYQCNDCSAICPRGAKPGDVLAAVRSIAIERFSLPTFVSRLFSDPRYLPLVFGIPAVILLALVAALRGFSFPEGEIEYDRFISDTAIEIAAIMVVSYALAVAGLGLLRFWRDLRMDSAEMIPAPGASSGGPGAMPATAARPSREVSLASTIHDIITHKGFRECETDRPRLWGHLAVFYGAPFLLFATALAALYSFIGAELQRPASDPAKIAGNLGAILLTAGVLAFAYGRLRPKKGSWGRTAYADWLLLAFILLLVVTGVLLEVARYSGAASWAYSLYLVHLVIVFAAFAYAPHGKLAHLYYRTAALTFMRHGGRAGRYKRYVLLPAALALGVGSVALLAGAGVGVVLLAQVAVENVSLPSAGVLTVYLPVADRSVNVILVVGAGFAVGILSGMTGVGGGFLMTPLLMTIGIPSAVAVGTDSAQIAGTGSSGALAHSRLGNVDVKLGLTIIAGSLIGGTIGVQAVRILREMGNFDFSVRIVYVVVLGAVGGLMLRESLGTWIRSARTWIIRALADEGFGELTVKLVEEEKPKDEGAVRRLLARLPLQTDYKKAKVRISVLFPAGMGFGIGFLAAIMGVGGGFIMVPAMIYVLGVPTHVAVGTDLFQIVFTSTNVAFQQAITNHNVDILLAVMLMVGAAIGAQIGARMSGRLEGHQLRTILGIIVVLVMLKLLFDLLLTPDSLFGLAPVSGGAH